MPDAKQVDEEAEVRRTARDLDHDRYLAALLSPSGARDDLLALAAFHGEIARIPVSASEPNIAAMRLQWWRDLLLDASSGEVIGSPVADRLRRALAGDAAATREAVSIIEAYEELLYPAALSAPGAVEAFADASQGSAFRLAARMLGGTAAEPQALPVIAAAAGCYGRVQLLRVLPILLHNGHNPFGDGPIADWAPVIEPLLTEARAGFDEVRRHAPLAAAPIRQAILPVALVGPYLKALERLGSKLAFEQATISPLQRVWRIWLANRRQRF